METVAFAKPIADDKVNATPLELLTTYGFICASTKNTILSKSENLVGGIAKSALSIMIETSGLTLIGLFTMIYLLNQKHTYTAIADGRLCHLHPRMLANKKILCDRLNLLGRFGWKSKIELIFCYCVKSNIITVFFFRFVCRIEMTNSRIQKRFC